VLREVARRIADRTRATDMASRMGGDEFLILLEEVEDGKQVEVHAKRLLDSISEPIETGSHSLRIGAAAGIAVYPEASRSREGLTHAADLAMYAAKARGENAICVYDDRLEGSLPAQAGIL
jgi:diguanylate cyclase (GGDEF)-like protein